MELKTLRQIFNEHGKNTQVKRMMPSSIKCPVSMYDKTRLLDIVEFKDGRSVAKCSDGLLLEADDPAYLVPEMSAVINIFERKKPEPEPKYEKDSDVDFDVLMKKNEANKKRMEQDRVKHNVGVTRRYRIKH